MALLQIGKGMSLICYPVSWDARFARLVLLPYSYFNQYDLVLWSVVAAEVKN